MHEIEADQVQGNWPCRCSTEARHCGPAPTASSKSTAQLSLRNASSSIMGSQCKKAWPCNRTLTSLLGRLQLCWASSLARRSWSSLPSTTRLQYGNQDDELIVSLGIYQSPTCNGQVTSECPFTSLFYYRQGCMQESSNPVARHSSTPFYSYLCRPSRLSNPCFRHLVTLRECPLHASVFVSIGCSTWTGTKSLYSYCETFYC